MIIQKSECRIRKKNDAAGFQAPVFSWFVVPAQGMDVGNIRDEKKFCCS